jgi:mitochondrial fission protein ELM1
MKSDVQTDEQKPRPLAGARAWLISSGMAGMDVQTRGVAEALGLDYEMKRVDPKGFWRVIAPWGPVAPAERFGAPGAQFAPPWPDIAISLGRGGVPYMRALRRRAGDATFTVVMQDPKTGTGSADMIWVPKHDRPRGPNVFTTLTAPHSFTAKRLAELRRTMPPTIAALPRPRVGVILGGKNAVYKFRDEDDERLARSLASLGRLGASFLITTSRRTHERLRRVVDEATRAFPRIFWDGQGANPYGDFLAHGDLFVVTADSVNMVGEACATGRPVLVFSPGGGSAKFRRFHTALQAHGATRPMPDQFTEVPQWSYDPLFSDDEIAREIERRWVASGRGRPGQGSHASGR